MKKFLSILLVSGIFTEISNFNVNALTNQQKKYAIGGGILGVGAIAIVANEIFNKQYNLRNLFKREEQGVQEERGEGWEKVANLYLDVAKQYNKNSAEYSEYMAEYHRCLVHLEIENHEQEEIYYLIASDRYKKSSGEYSEVKSAEMLAKRRECQYYATKAPGYTGGMVLDRENNRVVNVLDGDLISNCIDSWENVKNKKESYNSYADARTLEWRARYDTATWEDAANAWEIVKNDNSLRITFHNKNWEAFKAFAEANKQMCLLKCNKTTKEEAKRAWLDAHDKDLQCGGKVYKAFAAEAEQNANDIS